MIRKEMIIAIFILVICVGVTFLFQHKRSNIYDSKYSNCELGDLVGDDVERLEYKNFYIDYHKADFTKSQIEDYTDECLAEGVKSQYQMDCCMTSKMYAEK